MVDLETRWKSLDPRLRRALMIIGLADAGLRAIALADLARRPAGRVRGAKWKWAIVLTLANSAGIAPLTYFTRGRR